MDASLTGPKKFGFGLKARGLGCVVKAFAFYPMMGVNITGISIDLIPHFPNTISPF